MGVELRSHSKIMDFVRNLLLFTVALDFHGLSAKAIDLNRCRQETVVKELYRKLYRAITDNAICDEDKPLTNVELLNLGTPLSFLQISILEDHQDILIYHLL